MSLTDWGGEEEIEEGGRRKAEEGIVGRKGGCRREECRKEGRIV